MADIYYHGTLGSNSTGNGSQSNPYQYPISSHGAVGDRYLLRRGVLHMCANNYGWTPKMGLPGGATTRVGAWGEAQIPHAIIDNNHANGPTMNIGANATNRAELVIEDLWALASANPSYPFYLHSQAGALENITLRRCKATGTLGKATAKSGFIIAADNWETITNRNILLEDCEAHDNPEHGIIWTDTTVGIARRCKTSNNGLETGAHGISSFKKRFNVTSGWANVPATNIWYVSTSGNISLTTTDISALVIISGATSGTYPRFVKNTSTPTTPGAGEFGYDMANRVLYVNLNGASPNGQTLNYAAGTHTGIRFEFCDSWANRAWLGYTYHEGHGFALDDFTGESFIIGCRAWDNEGNGISLNRGDNNTVSGNVIWNNWWPAISISRGKNCRIVNNVSWGNNRAASHGSFTNFNTSDVYVGAMSTSALVQNNVLLTVARDYGLLVDASSASGSSAVSNYLSGAVARASGITETSPVTTDPAPWMNDDGSLKTTIPIGGIPMPNPLRNAGTYVQGVTLRNGRTQPGMTPIGAYQVGRY